MDNILFSNLNEGTLERMFEKVRKFCHVGGYKLLLKIIQSRDPINYLGYKIRLLKV